MKRRVTDRKKEEEEKKRPIPNAKDAETPWEEKGWPMLPLHHACCRVLFSSSSSSILGGLDGLS